MTGVIQNELLSAVLAVTVTAALVVVIAAMVLAIAGCYEYQH